MDSSIMSFLSTLISVISPLLIFGACCYYFSKEVKADSILLFIGSGLTLLLACFYRFLMPYLMDHYAMPMSEVNSYYFILGVISFFAGICFAVGLFMLINNMINASKMIQGKF